MPKFLLAFLACGAALFGATVSLPAVSGAPRVAGPATEPVLLELFTSQGCSSCPPADRFAERLAADRGLVVVSRPVTYWDRLGWKDTLARDENTDLQRAYAGRGLGGQNGVYTPQVAVNGRWGAVGSNEAEVRRLVAAAAKDRQAALRVRPLPDGSFAVGIAGTTGARAELSLIAVSAREEVAIGRGENGGRKVAYVNVLRDERVIAE